MRFGSDAEGGRRWSLIGAGFEHVKVTDEKAFPIDCLTSDLTTNVVFDSVNISLEQMKEMGRSVVSAIMTDFKPK